MHPVDIYKTTDGDVVAIEQIVLYTNLGTNSRHLVSPGATLVDRGGKKYIDTPHGSRSEMRELDILQQKIGVPFEDYQAALSEVYPAQVMRIRQIQAINSWYGSESARISHSSGLDPTPEQEAERKRKQAELGVELERRKAELVTVPSLLDVIDS